MIPPVTYQGGKGRLAVEIVAKMAIPREATFYDLCCGSGAVALAAVAAGHPIDRVVMVEQGPWGLFWQAIGAGVFDLEMLHAHCHSVPENPRAVKAYIETLYRKQPAQDVVQVYLLLQAATVGGAALFIENGAWKRTSGFRDYWLPTATSSRRSPVNPMMPMPTTIYERVVEITTKMRGVRGIHGDAARVRIEPPAVVYIDPQYSGTTGYGYTIDAVKVAEDAAACGATVWVSEGRALSDEAVCLSGGRSKGGITGDRKRAANEEWLSCFRRVAR